MDKATIRRQFRHLRETLLPHEVESASRGVCQQLSQWPPFLKAQTVLAYLPFRNEIDLRSLFEPFAHVRWLAPRVDGKRLVLHPYLPDRLTLHRFGMWEPSADLPAVGPAEIDLVLVPGVAFDRRGYRLGLGGGYYDRFLPTCPAGRAGIAYPFALLDELPAEGHDQRVGWVVTPAQIIDCTGGHNE